MGEIRRKPSSGVGSTPTSVGLGNVTNDLQVKVSEKGAVNGVASLDANGKVPATQLPAGTDGSASGGAGGPVPLRTGYTPSTVTRSPAHSAAYGGFGSGLYIDITPTVDTLLAGLTDTCPHSDATGIVAQVWQASTSALLTSSPAVAAGARSGRYTAQFDTPVMLLAGVGYRVGWSAVNGNISENGPAIYTYSGFSTTGKSYAQSGLASYPNSQAGSAYEYSPSFDLVTATASAKGVVGPLDPLDFPAVTAVASIPNGGTARLSGSNPAKIYVRSSSGQLFEFTGTAVSG